MSKFVVIYDFHDGESFRYEVSADSSANALLYAFLLLIEATGRDGDNAWQTVIVRKD